MTTEDTIDKISNLIDNRTVNDLYEERGFSFEREEYDHLVFMVINYADDPDSFFKRTVLDIVAEIRRMGIEVFDMYYDFGNYVIETAKS